MLNRICFLLALAGMLLSFHLWIQKERNFDRGCWGFGSPTSAAAPIDCRDPALKQVDNILGISTAALGYWFYFVMAGLSLGRSLLAHRTAIRCHAVAELATAAAAPFCAYLIYYQAFVAKAYCPLCLTSAALVAGIAALHIVWHLRGGLAVSAGTDRLAEVGYISTAGFAAVGCLAALVLADRAMMAPPGTELETGRIALTTDGRLGTAPDVAGAARPGPDAAMAKVRTADWITPSTPVLGAARGVPVLAFFDPNCPHCGGVYAMVEQLADEFKEQVAIYIVPRVLWKYSVAQVEALELARKQDKYFEMWRLQFARPKAGGMSLGDIQGLFESLQLNSQDLERRLNAEGATVLALRDKAKVAGINSTPTLFVDGALVPPPSRNHDGIVRLIQQAIKSRQREPAGMPTPATGADRTAGMPD